MQEIGIPNACGRARNGAEFDSHFAGETGTALALPDDDKEQIYDVAVVGAGIVGLAAALALAGAGHRTVLIERQTPRRQRGALGFDIRSVALTSASLRFLQGLAGLDGVTPTPIETMRVWEHDGAARLRFEADETLAWVVENSALVDSLWRMAAARLETMAPATVTALSASDSAVTLAVQDGDGAERGITARLVVAADGAASPVRALAGVATRREPMSRLGEQCAVATVARTEMPHRNIAWQRFGKTGPVALLPLAEAHMVSVIWSGDAAQSERLLALGDAAFSAALGGETEHVLGRIEAVDQRYAFPAAQTLAAHLNPTPRILLAGDAARTIHPLAGQGVNVGLEDARAIAAVAAKEGVGDLGRAGLWRDYARRRRRRSKMMMALMRALLAAYCGAGAQGPWRRLARNEALRRIDASNAAKAQLVREAMGLGAFA